MNRTIKEGVQPCLKNKQEKCNSKKIRHKERKDREAVKVVKLKRRVESKA